MANKTTQMKAHATFHVKKKKKKKMTLRVE